MIKITGLKGNEFILNDDHIEKIEETQGSATITLSNGNKYIVVETGEELIQKVLEYRRKIMI